MAAAPQWKADDVGINSARNRAFHAYSLDGVSCERCEQQPAIDRHHVDGNTINNDPSNIQFLCRRCHMEVDGRLTAFVEGPKRPRSAGRVEADKLLRERPDLPGVEVARLTGVSEATISRAKAALRREQGDG
jgi:uncharacterized protein YlaI